MKDEALKLALDALEAETDPNWECNSYHPKIWEAITAIKQALALDKKAENARELGLDYEPADGTQVSKVWWDGEKLMAKPIPLEDFYLPAQPAPVQPVGTYGEIYESMQALLRTGLQRDQQIYMEMKDKPLYTTPPAAQRQWVGLTDEEYFEIGQRHWVTSTKIELIHAEIEAKLREKNT
jgi:hypothetical protein